MINRKKKGVKALAYTFVILGAVCLTKVPMTNSKYIKASELNNEYFEYSAGFIKLTNEKESFPSGTTPVGNGQGTSEVNFKIPRNIDNGIESDSTIIDTYRFEPKNGCTINTINEIQRPNNEISFNRKQRENITVSMTCPTTFSTSSLTDDLLYVSVTLGQTLNTNASLDVYEKIGSNNVEDEFLYRSYEEQFTSTITSESSNSITINNNSNKPFNEFIEWIVKYAHSSEAQGNLDLIKKYISDKIEDDVKVKIGTSYEFGRLPYYISTLYNDVNNIPIIQGINKKENENDITFSIDSNLIGYIKTYNFVKTNTNDNILDLYFSVPVQESNKLKINDIYDEYIKSYFGLEETDENYNVFIEYIKDSAYEILANNRQMPGIIKEQQEQICIIHINDKNALYNAATIYENASFDIKNNLLNGADFKSEFDGIMANKIVIEGTQNQSQIINSRIENIPIAYYANNGYDPERINYKVDRYIIYPSKSDESKYLLIKISRKNETEMTISLYDFDTAIENNQIFSLNSENTEIYLNIDVKSTQRVTDEEFGKVTYIVEKLNNNLNNTYVPERPSKPTYSNNGVRYIYFKYEMNNTNTILDETENELDQTDVETIQDEETNKVKIQEEDTKGINTPNMDISDIDKPDEKVDEDENIEGSNNIQEQPISEETAELTEMTELNKNKLKMNYSNTYKLPESISTIEDINSSNQQEEIPNVNEISENKSSEVIVDNNEEEQHNKIEDTESEKVIEDATITEGSTSEVLSE